MLNFRKARLCNPLRKLDSNVLLNDTEVSKEFNRIVHDRIQHSDPLIDKYETLTTAMNTAASSILTQKVHNSPDWFTENEAELTKLIEKRNFAILCKMNRATRRTTDNLRTIRKQLKSAISRAKNNWIKRICDKVNRTDNTRTGTHAYWESIKLLKRGMEKPPPNKQTMMIKQNGDKCNNSEENAEVFRDHFEKLYDRPATFDPSVLDFLEQQPLIPNIDSIPDDDEIRKAISHLKNKAPGNSSLTPQMFKSLLNGSLCFNLLKDIIVDIWVNEICPKDWNTGLLRILPKKGDLRKPGNYRGIMLLESSYKIIAILIHSRLQPLIENLDHESQCGFRKDKGCLCRKLPTR